MSKDSLSRDIYVDNLITVADNEEETSQLYQSNKIEFKEISMNLRDRKSSSSDVNKLFKDDKIKGSKIKVLGLLWDTAKKYDGNNNRKVQWFDVGDHKKTGSDFCCMFI